MQCKWYNAYNKYTCHIICNVRHVNRIRLCGSQLYWGYKACRMLMHIQMLEIEISAQKFGTLIYFVARLVGKVLQGKLSLESLLPLPLSMPMWQPPQDLLRIAAHHTKRQWNNEVQQMYKTYNVKLLSRSLTMEKSSSFIIIERNSSEWNRDGMESVQWKLGCWMKLNCSETIVFRNWAKTVYPASVQ